jgi:hypothetical protein
MLPPYMISTLQWQVNASLYRTVFPRIEYIKKKTIGHMFPNGKYTSRRKFQRVYVTVRQNPKEHSRAQSQPANIDRQNREPRSEPQRLTQHASE